MVLEKRKVQYVTALALAGIIFGGGLCGCQTAKKESANTYQPRWATEAERAEMDGSYVKYLWGNKDYRLVYGHIGVGYYLDWTSFVLFQDRGKGPGVLRFAVNTFSYSKEHGVGETVTWEFFETRNGAYVRTNNGNYRPFDMHDNFGYNHPAVDVFNQCMIALRD